jgi:hypothetical protein
VKSSLAIFCSYFLYCAYMFTFGYPVNLCPYLWLPCHPVFLSLATLSFYIIVPGYTLSFCNLISGFLVILYSYFWFPYSSVCLFLATIPLCIIIPGYPFILYPCLWLPCHFVSLSLSTPVILFPYLKLCSHFNDLLSGYPCYYALYFQLPCQFES